MTGAEQSGLTRKGRNRKENRDGEGRKGKVDGGTERQREREVEEKRNWLCEVDRSGVEWTNK